MNSLPRIAVFQHVKHSVVNLESLIDPQAFDIEVIKFCDGQEEPEQQEFFVDNYQGLVVLGGAITLTEIDQYPWLQRELSILEAALDTSLPILGICLGAQLLAMALGGKVYPHTHKEIGWYELTPAPEAKTDPLFSSFGESETVFHWHSDTFSLPKGAQRLAYSKSCENQAFRYGENVYGVQFHPEMTDKQNIESWLTDDIGKAELSDSTQPFYKDAILEDTACQINRYQKVSSDLFSGFLSLAPARR